MRRQVGKAGKKAGREENGGIDDQIMRGADRGYGEVAKVVRGEMVRIGEGGVSLVDRDDLDAFWKVHRTNLLMQC